MSDLDLTSDEDLDLTSKEHPDDPDDTEQVHEDADLSGDPLPEDLGVYVTDADLAATAEPEG